MLALLVDSEGVDLDAKEYGFDRSALYYAAQHGSEQMVCLLLEARADPDSKRLQPWRGAPAGRRRRGCAGGVW